MAILVTVTSTGESRTIPDNGAVAVPAGGGLVYQIRLPDENGVPGPVLDPSVLTGRIAGDDYILVLPDGTTLTFEGLVPLFTDADRSDGIAGPDGRLAIHSLETALATAAGNGQGGDGPSGGGSIIPVEPYSEDGFGAPFGASPLGDIGIPLLPGFDLPDVDPNLVETNDVVMAEAAAPPPVPAVAEDDALSTTDVAVRAAPFMADLLENDEGPAGLAITEVDPASLELALPGDISETGRTVNPLGPGEVLNVDVSLFSAFTFLRGTLNIRVLAEGKVFLEVVDRVPLGSMTSGDQLVVSFDYGAGSNGTTEDQARAEVRIDGINSPPMAGDINILQYEGIGFGTPGTSSFSEFLPADDFEVADPFFDLSVALTGPNTIPAEAGLSVFGTFLFFFPFLDLADDRTVTGGSDYRVENLVDGAETASSITVTVRSDTIASPLVGSDDPLVLDMLFDNDPIPGRDSILDGRAGVDRLFGFNGDDTLFGGDDTDFLDGGTGTNRLEGGNGDDFLRNSPFGGGGTLFGQDGNDDLSGGSGDELLFGGDGEDILSGNGGTDSLLGDAGADTFSFAVGVFGLPAGSPVFDHDILLDFDPATETLLFGSFAAISLTPSLASLDGLIAPGGVTVGNLGLGDAGTADVSVTFSNGDILSIADLAAFTSFTDLEAAFPGSVTIADF